MAEHGPERSRKFRQAAIVYLHYAVLYAAGARALMERGLLPAGRGPSWVWLSVGVGVGLAVTAALWWWQNAWFARVVWLLVALRLPALVERAFLSSPGSVPSGLYVAAGVVVLVNLAFLARAAWDV